MSDMINKIVVLCCYPFPEGMAPSVRILSYCKGLHENGVHPEIISFGGRFENDGYPQSGEIDGIPYRISHHWCMNKSRLHRVLIDKQLFLLKTIYYIIRTNQKEKIDYILLSFDSVGYLKLYVPILRFLGLKLIFIGDEYPEPIRKLKSEVPKRMLTQYKHLYRHIDARILMTKALQNFYDVNVCERPTHILCSILNTERFKNLAKIEQKRPYLCYMGNMMLAKDNVDNIIEAFSYVAEDFPDYDLLLYGTPSEIDRKTVENKISCTGMVGRVFIMGRANYSEVPQILTNAKILVTSQPITKRAEGGFPTKLAEYMMSRTPAIVTDVGEISEYVRDSDTVYMVPPCAPIAYSEKIRFIITHPEEAALVSERAYEYAMTNFEGKSVTSKLLTFLEEL